MSTNTPTPPQQEPFSASVVTVIPARSTWEKWLYYNADMFMRHIGTAGMVWAGVSLQQGVVQWKSLGVALLSGAILPTIFTILAKGLPGMGEGATVSVNSGNIAPAVEAPPAVTQTPK